MCGTRYAPCAAASPSPHPAAPSSPCPHCCRPEPISQATGRPIYPENYYSVWFVIDRILQSLYDGSPYLEGMPVTDRGKRIRIAPVLRHMLRMPKREEQPPIPPSNGGVWDDIGAGVEGVPAPLQPSLVPVFCTTIHPMTRPPPFPDWDNHPGRISWHFSAVASRPNTGQEGVINRLHIL